MLKRDIVQPGTWIPMLKAGTRLTPELIAKIRRIGLESVALDCVEGEPRTEPRITSLLSSGEIKHLEAILSGSGGQTELRQIVYDVVRRLAQLRNVPEFRVVGPYERTHAINVFTLSLVVGQALDYGPAQLVSLGTGALLHDIGKQVLPGAVVGKTAELDVAERDLLRCHPVLGVALLTRARRFSRWLLSRETLEVVRCHHERLDGSGYPGGLAGREIPRMATIAAVADVYDAMVSDRVHARRKAPGIAFQTIRSLAGQQFDAVVVEAFCSRVLPYPTGSEVFLTDRRKATVLRATRETALRPLVEVDGQELDLAEQRGLGIANLCLRRCNERVAISVPVRIRPQGDSLPLWGKCLDLSADGASLEIVGDASRLTTIDLQFCTGGGQAPAVRGKVCWSRPAGDGSWRVGINAAGDNLLTTFAQTARVS